MTIEASRRLLARGFNLGDPLRGHDAHFVVDTHPVIDSLPFNNKAAERFDHQNNRSHAIEFTELHATLE